MNNHQYTDPRTQAPDMYIYGWLKGENYRMLRNSSSESVYLEAKSSFREHLLARGFDPARVDAQLERGWHDRQRSMIARPKSKGRAIVVSIARTPTYQLVSDYLRRAWFFARGLRPDVPTLTIPVVRGGNLASITDRANKKVLAPEQSDKDVVGQGASRMANASPPSESKPTSRNASSSSGPPNLIWAG